MFAGNVNPQLLFVVWHRSLNRATPSDRYYLMNSSFMIGVRMWLSVGWVARWVRSVARVWNTFWWLKRKLIRLERIAIHHPSIPTTQSRVLSYLDWKLPVLARLGFDGGGRTPTRLINISGIVWRSLCFWYSVTEFKKQKHMQYWYVLSSVGQ